MLKFVVVWSDKNKPFRNIIMKSWWSTCEVKFGESSSNVVKNTKNSSFSKSFKFHSFSEQWHQKYHLKNIYWYNVINIKCSISSLIFHVENQLQKSCFLEYVFQNLIIDSVFFNGLIVTALKLTSLLLFILSTRETKLMTWNWCSHCLKRILRSLTANDDP